MRSALLVLGLLNFLQLVVSDHFVCMCWICVTTATFHCSPRRLSSFAAADDDNEEADTEAAVGPGHGAGFTPFTAMLLASNLISKAFRPECEARAAPERAPPVLCMGEREGGRERERERPPVRCMGGAQSPPAPLCHLARALSTIQPSYLPPPIFGR